MTDNLTPEERRQLRALAEQAAAERSWQATLNKPGKGGDIARYLQWLDNAIRDVAPDLGKEERQALWNAWLEDFDAWDAPEQDDKPLDYTSYIVGWQSALLHHGIIKQAGRGERPRERFPKPQ